MLLSSVITILFSLSVYASPSPAQGPRRSCSDDPALAGFINLDGITSFCQNAFRPTTTLTSRVTVTLTPGVEVRTTVTVTTTSYRGTSITYFVPTPTLTAACASSNARLVQAPPTGAASGGFITASTAPSSPTTAPLAARDNPRQNCPKVTDQLSSACSCFITSGITQTAATTQTFTVTSPYTYTLTTTATSTVINPHYRARTLAVGCEPQNANLYHAISYGGCGSPGLGLLDYTDCPYAHQPVPAFGFDAADCCTACAQSLNCFQGYSDAYTGQCTLSYRTGNVQYNATVFTPDCPMGKTVAIFSDPNRPEENLSSGFVRGHCAYSC